MKVFLMRHGEAEDIFDMNTDASRELTERGRKDTVEIIEQYRHELATVNTLWVSPYTRTQQTAAIITQTLQHPVTIETKPALVPSATPQHMIEALQQQTSETILLVTHQPLVGILVDTLAGLEPGMNRMGTSALACIEADVFAKDCGELRWLHQPEFNGF